MMDFFEDLFGYFFTGSVFSGGWLAVLCLALAIIWVVYDKVAKKDK